MIFLSGSKPVPTFHVKALYAVIFSHFVILLCQLMKSEKKFSTDIRIFCREDTKAQSFTKSLCPSVFQISCHGLQRNDCSEFSQFLPAILTVMHLISEICERLRHSVISDREPSSDHKSDWYHRKPNKEHRKIRLRL